MSARSRQKQIVEMLAAGELSVAQLADMLGISAITIRRDLSVLAGQGQVVRTHGGAMLPDATSFHSKGGKNQAAKAYIGKLAAAQVQEGEVIFMDCGSTVFQMCAHLRRLSRLTVVTNSLPVVNELVGHPGFTINLIGGELDTQRKAVHGSMALEHIQRYRAAKAFVGVDGFSLANGLSASGEKEASITLAMAGQSAVTFLLCDVSKLERDSYFRFADSTLFAHMITDQSLPEATARAYADAGISVMK